MPRLPPPTINISVLPWLFYLHDRCLYDKLPQFGVIVVLVKYLGTFFREFLYENLVHAK